MNLLSYSEDDINYRTAYNAHHASSFTPDVRANQERRWYYEAMKELEDEFAKFATDENEVELKADLEAYRQRYIKMLHARLAADSRCMSSMITGSSNFPVRRNQKRLDTAHKRSTEFLEWREKALEHLRKKYDPARASRVISSDAPDAVEQLQAKIAEAERRQEQMKADNKLVRGAHEAYELTNNSANIRRMKQRLSDLERELAQRTDEPAEREVNGVRIVENTDNNRIQLFFPGKPASEIIAKLKARGFHWSRLEGAWQRQLNDNGRAGANEIVEGMK